MLELKHQYRCPTKPEELVEFLGFAPDILMKNASLSVGAEIVLIALRSFNEKAREVVDSHQDIKKNV